MATEMGMKWLTAKPATVRSDTYSPKREVTWSQYKMGDNFLFSAQYLSSFAEIPQWIRNLLKY